MWVLLRLCILVVVGFGCVVGVVVVGVVDVDVGGVVC